MADKSKYTLTLHLTGKPIDDCRLTLDADVDATALKCVLCLTSLEVKKEMYKPGHIHAVVQVFPQSVDTSKKNSQIDIDLFDKLLGKKVTLSYSISDTQSVAIAEDYMVFDYSPEYKADSNETSLYVTLDIYSPEKILSFKKFNKSYVGLKLGEEIMKQYAGQVGKISYENMQHLIFDASTSKETIKYEEFRQPYLVQFDETPLDFLARTANRCGEFLFFENGVWQLGINAKNALKKGTRDVAAYSSLTFQRSKKRDMAAYWVNNYVDPTDPDEPTLPEKATDADKATYKKALDEYNKKVANNFKEGMRSYMGPAEENVFSFTEKAETFKGGLVDTITTQLPSYYIGKINTWLSKDSWGSILGFAAFNVALDNSIAIIKKRGNRQKWNKRNVKPYDSSDYSEQIITDKDGLKTISPFTNIAALKKYKRQFYLSVLQREHEAERKAIHVDLSNQSGYALLGELVSVNGLNGHYIVTSFSFSQDMRLEKDTTGMRKHVTGLPKTSFDAVPLIKSNDGVLEAYPTPFKEGTIRKVEPQTAIVTSVDDPLELGRIKIRYPWQSKDDKQHSPWIRISAPFTSKGAALRFQPQVGDEVMVGYENGDIERPFMMGALQSTENEGSAMRNEYGIKEGYILQSPNGHYIKFSNPANYKKFLLGLSPLMSSMNTYLMLSGTFDEMMGKAGKEWAGGITLGDKLGFYQIDMSTDKRSVSITSSLGNVSLNAFTGITISAPSGNVKIEGKNIEIAAGNNLKLTSGNNFKPKNPMTDPVSGLTKFAQKTAMAELNKFLLRSIKPIDMTFVRTVVEAFVKPIGGTLLIKSNRFLRLEAGKGSTNLPVQAYRQGGETQKEMLEKKLNEYIVWDVIRYTDRVLEGIFERFRALYIRATEASLRYYFQRHEAITESLSIACDDAANNSIETAAEAIEIAFNRGITHDRPLSVLLTKLQQTDNIGRNRKNDCITKADALGQAIQEGKDFFEKFEVDPLPFQCSNEGTALAELLAQGNYAESCHNYKTQVIVALKVEVMAYLKKMFEDDLHNNFVGVTQWQPGKLDDLKHVFHRRTAFQVIKMLADNNLISVVNEDAGSGKVSSALLLVPSTLRKERYKLVKVDSTKGVWPSADEACKDQRLWDDFVMCIKVNRITKGPEDGAVMRFAKKVIDNTVRITEFDRKEWAESHLANPEVQGEILMSDTSGNTININGREVKVSHNSPLKDAMTKLSQL